MIIMLDVPIFRTLTTVSYIILAVPEEEYTFGTQKFDLALCIS